jgi:hypothetical protein
VTYVGAATVLPPASAARPDLGQAAGAAALFAVQHDERDGGAVVVEARFGGVSAPHDLREFRVLLARTPIGAGPRYATEATLGRTFQTWRWRLEPGRSVEQEIDGRRVPMPAAPVWPADDGRHWFRLQFQRGADVWRDVPIGYAEARNGRFVAARQVTALAQILSPEPGPAPSLPRAGTLVKGAGDDVFLVSGGALRWIPSLQVLQQHDFVWEMVQQVDERLLAVWPVGLPLE